MALAKYICLNPVLPKYQGLGADYESQEQQQDFRAILTVTSRGALVPTLTVAMVTWGDVCISDPPPFIILGDTDNLLFGHEIVFQYLWFYLATFQNTDDPYFITALFSSSPGSLVKKRWKFKL